MIRTLATSLISPILYLLAFGYGLGRGITLNGHSYLDFVVPGIIALTAMTSSFTGASSKLHVDRLFYKCFDELLIAPISTYSIIVGKAFAGAVRGLISSIAMFVVGAIVSPRLATSSMLSIFLIVLLLSCLVFALLGELVALTVKSHQDMGTFSSLIIIPMTFLSGTFFSLEGVHETVRIALYLLPLTHSSLCLRASALNQPFPWISLIALIAYGAIFFVMCVLAIKRASI